MAASVGQLPTWMRVVQVAAVLLLLLHAAAAVWYILMLAAWLSLTAVLGKLVAIPIISTLGMLFRVLLSMKPFWK